jgi:ubiquinone/menaquinone biosynthesis C-methylase UbiE
MNINAKKYNTIEKGIFAPIYPVIADQIINMTGVTEGHCIDIGCGGGSLGTAIARKTNLFVHFFDKSDEMLSLVHHSLSGSELKSRYEIIHGDAASINLPDESINLAVSRGSVFFWEDLSEAFSEIYRVLFPDGWAYIGGGFGSRELRESILKISSEAPCGENEPFRKRIRHNLGDGMRERFESALKSSGINTYSILQSEDIGLWVVFTK